MANTTSPKNTNKNSNEPETILDSPEDLASQEVMTLPKGTIIHVKNVAVELGEDAEISTTKNTWKQVQDVVPNFAEANEKSNEKSKKDSK